MKLLDGIEHELNAARSWLDQARRDGAAATHALEQLAEHAENARHTARTAVLMIRGKWPMDEGNKTEG
jgi:hypothetical protein